MGCDRAAPAAPTQAWSSALLAHARDHEHNLLPPVGRGDVAVVAKGPAAQEHRLSLVQSVARHGSVRDHKPPARHGRYAAVLRGLPVQRPPWPTTLMAHRLADVRVWSIRHGVTHASDIKSKEQASLTAEE